MTAKTNGGPYGIGASQWPGLAKLMEECGEVIQVLSKLLVAPDMDHTWVQPDGTTRGSGDLGDRLTEELGDLDAALRFFLENNDERLDGWAIADRSQFKYETFTRWHAEGHLDATAH